MFLATTGLTEFWNKDEEILFLGPWCKRYERREEWESLSYQTFPCLWDDRERFFSAIAYLDQCFERLLRELTSFFNELHQVSFSTRYWRILLGSWLLKGLHITYDRYILITEVFSKYPQLESVVMDHRSFKIPLDFSEMSSLVQGDHFNLQIFTQIIHSLGFNFPCRMIDNSTWAGERTGGRQRGIPREMIYHLVNSAEKAIQQLMGTKWETVLCDLYCPRWMVWKIALRSRLRALPLTLNNRWDLSIERPFLVSEKRDALLQLPALDEFEQVFIKTLPSNLPALYFELFSKYRENINRKIPSSPRVLMTATGWEKAPFQFLAAEFVEQNRRLVAFQHGGGYGIFRDHCLERYERIVSDTFYDWGAGEQNLPVPKLSEFFLRSSCPSIAVESPTVLFVGTSDPPYLQRFYSLPAAGQWDQFFEWETIFLGVVSDEIRKNIIFRSYHLDFGRNIRGNFSNSFPEIRWDDGKPLHKVLGQPRLVIIDNCNTTLLEVLVFNVPVVLFWNPNMWEAREEALSFFRDFRDVGILHDSPEEAAAKVNEVYGNPWLWWRTEKLQNAREGFIRKYALCRQDWEKKWAVALSDETKREKNARMQKT